MSEVISYKLTGDWRHIVEDGLVDLDDLPDEALPTGHVEFIPVSPKVAVSGSPETAYTVSSFKSLIAGGVLTDLQGREGVQIAGWVGDTPVYWRAVTHLEYRGKKIPYPDVEFTLEGDSRLTGIVASGAPGESATIYHPRIEALIDELDNKSNVGHSHQITDVEGLMQALEDASYSGGGGDGSSGPVSWTQVRNKPTTFPPSSHTHPLGDVSGLQAALDAKVGNTDPRLSDARDPKAHTHSWASLTGKPGTFPPEGHGHTISDISGLQQALEDAANSGTGGGGGDGSPVTWISILNKPSEFPPEAHTHLIRDVSGLQGALDEKVGDTDPRLTDARTPKSHTHYWSEVTGKPLSFPPATHTHQIGDTTGLQGALDSKVGNSDPRLTDDRTPTAHTHVWDEVTERPSAFPPEVHGHSISQVTGLQGALDSKSATGHGHSINDVDGLQAALDDAASSGESGPVSWTDVIDKPTEFNPSAHGHEIAEINGLQAALDAASGGEGDSGTALYIVGAPYNTYFEVPDPVEGDIFLGGDGTVFRHNDIGLWLIVGAINPANISGWQIADLAVTKGKLAQDLQDEITGHSHEIADVNGLQGELDDKVDDTDPRLTDPRTPTEHTHAWSEVTDKPITFPATWTSVIGKPPNFPPSTHEHQISEINGLQDELDGKADQSAVDGKIEAAGSATTVWSGTQAEYDALPESTRHAVGFIGVIV